MTIMFKDVILFNRDDSGFTHPRYAQGLLDAGFEIGVVGTGSDLISDIRRKAMLAAGITPVTNPNQWWTEGYQSPGAIMRQGWHMKNHRDIQSEYGIRFTHFLNDIEDWMTKLFDHPFAGQWASTTALGDAARLDTQHMLAVFELLKEASGEFDLSITDWAQYGLPRGPSPLWPSGSVNFSAAMAYTLNRHKIRCGNAIYPRSVWDTAVGPATFAQATSHDMLVIYPCWRERPGRPYADPREYLGILKPKPHTQFWIWDNYTHHSKSPEQNRDWAMQFLEARKELHGQQHPITEAVMSSAE